VKRWAPVEILWLDAHGGGDTWIPLDPKHGRPATIRTVGILERETPEGYVVVLSHDKAAGVISSYLFVPNGNVVEITELKK
jgi:hypothetical protein